MALIFSFVVMVMLTGLLYSFKMGLLTTKSIIKNSNEKVLGETYILNAKNDINFTKSGEFQIADSKFEIIVNDDNISSFFPNSNNAELFQSQEYNSYNVIYKAFNLGAAVDLKERIIYNALSANLYQNFGGEYVAINVPMINTAAITDYRSRVYRLADDGTLKDTSKGFIGFIQKQNKQINIFTKNAKIGVAIPDSMGVNYKVKVGWNLEKGQWSVYLLLYDTDKLFTTHFLLDDILNEDVKGLAPENEELGNDIGQWKAVIQGGSRSGSSGGQFLKDNIFDVVWYFDEGDEPPQLMLIRKADKKKGNREVLEVYYSTPLRTSDNYTLKLADKLEFKTKLSDENVKLLVPDTANNLDANMVLIFHPNNQSKTLMGVSDFNYNGDHRIGKSLDTYIDGETFGRPVIISKNEDSMYIITFEPKKIHRYEYVKGYGGFETLDYGSNGIEKEFDFGGSDDDIIVGSTNPDEDKQSGDIIQLIVPKFGYLFVFTNSKVMQLNYDLDILQEVGFSDFEAPQILADFDAVKDTINKIYIQANALDLKVQEIRDSLGDEDEPSDENEVDDQFQTQTGSSKNAKNNENDKDESEDIVSDPVYLDGKYLYPLGIVKKVVL
ncbi:MULTISPECIES: hypothetical protein [unclassified Francisella]|uniref:hypothetical protein n=1 Tax=unclassified Francisella TaxID=2610885 RepID=UPI002E364505|nr:MULTISPECIES: hypothetical protein [unclassified Francisella]MED7820072.1 hypothetical protein [Francisella sp. 19S2-4]MED7830892.1 hypothetical protein [Francisella sp. 19S2-10]